MTAPAHRIKEFKTRQIYYRNCFIIRLNKIKDKRKYTTYVWFSKIIPANTIDSGMYNDEDPYTLMDIAEAMIGKRKSGHLLLTPELLRGKAKKGIKTRKDSVTKGDTGSP